MRRNKRRSSVKKVVKDALRQAPPGSKQSPRFRVEPHSFKFKPGIDVNKLSQLVDELEVEEYRRKFTR